MGTPCKPCGGTGKVVCPWCDGKYHRRGETEDLVCDVCHNGKVRCEECDGTGVDLWN